MKGKIIIVLTVLAIGVHESRQSAIPMWEFLSRDEKMNHLYSMFAKQVQTYCKDKLTGDVSKCKKNMMMYGVTKLNEMLESHLDAMDPYQRNANKILWDSMMDGHDGAKDERQQHEEFKQQNPLFKEEATGNEEISNVGSTDQYEDDVHNNYLHAATNQQATYVNKPDDLDNHEHLEQNTNYLMGSMVSYMMPDGSPVKEKMFNSLPKDDDRDDMMMGQRKMPTMQQLYASIKTMDEKPKIIMELPPPTTSSSSSTTDQTAVSPQTIGSRYGLQNYRIH